MNRYRIRMYESGDGDGGIAAGTIVLAVDRGFSLDAASTEDAERRIRKDVIDGKLEVGRVYKISPAASDSESVLTVAFSEDAHAQRVTLEPAMGIYSEFRRLRYVAEIPVPQPAPLEQYPAPA